MKYTNEIEVRVDFSDVDPSLLDGELDEQEQISTVTKSETPSVDDSSTNGSDLDDSNLDNDELQPTAGGRPTRFFKKKS